jgi:hypothetical protein
MDFNAIISESGIQIGALILSILRMGINGIKYFSDTRKKVHDEYARMIAYYIMRGVVLSAARVKRLKNVLAQKHEVNAKRLDDIYTVLTYTYCEYMSSDAHTDHQKMHFEYNFKKYAKHYREPRRSDAVLLRTFLKDAGSVTAIMFFIILGYIFFMNLDFSCRDYVIIAFVLWSYSITINLLLQPLSYYLEKRRRKKKLRHAREIIKALCRESKHISRSD